MSAQFDSSLNGLLAYKAHEGLTGLIGLVVHKGLAGFGMVVQPA
jgi:hypothetical protein